MKDEEFVPYANRIVRLVNNVYPNMALKYGTELACNIFVFTLPRDMITAVWKVCECADINKAGKTAELLDTAKLAEHCSNSIIDC